MLKGTHTVYFSSSLYIINQKPMIHKTDFHCITTSVARSSGRNFYLHGILNNINEQDTSFLDCKHKHMMKCGPPPENLESCTVCLPIESHGFKSRINSKGYHSLFTVHISVF